MSFSIESLNLIWDALKFLLEDNLKERLRPKGSNEIAKNRAYQLYVLLKQMDINAEMYVVNIKKYLTSIETKENQETIETNEKNLKNSINSVRETLEKIEKGLNEINPQLEIHRPEIVNLILGYSHSRGQGLALLSLALAARRRAAELDANKSNNIISPKKERLILETNNLAKIRNVLKQAEKNQKRIKLIINDFREFLALEFSFKDSF